MVQAKPSEQGLGHLEYFLCVNVQTSLEWASFGVAVCTSSGLQGHWKATDWLVNSCSGKRLLHYPQHPGACRGFQDTLLSGRLEVNRDAGVLLNAV